MTDSRETSPASEKPEWSLVVEPQAAYILRDGDLAACATSFPPGETGAKHAIPRLQRLVAAANASASPALASEGLAGLSQALPTRHDVVQTLDRAFGPLSNVGPGWGRVVPLDDYATIVSRAADAILALFRESRESRPPVAPSVIAEIQHLRCPTDKFVEDRDAVSYNDAIDDVLKILGAPPVATSDEQILDAFAWRGPSTESTRAGCDRIRALFAAPAESVERCKYCGFSGTAEGVEMHPCDRRDAAKSEASDDVRTAVEGLCADCGATFARGCHRWVKDASYHPFKAVESVEEPRCAYVHPSGKVCDTPKKMHGAVGHPFTAVPPVAREEKPQCHCGAELPCLFHKSAPAASPRRAAIEKMRERMVAIRASFEVHRKTAADACILNLMDACCELTAVLAECER